MSSMKEDDLKLALTGRMGVIRYKRADLHVSLQASLYKTFA